MGPPGKQIYHSYFKKHNIVFTLIPKNACTSIKYSLLKTFSSKLLDIDNYKDNVDIFHARTLPFFNFIDNPQLYDLKNVFSISVVRNPFDRLVSGWKDKIRNLNRNKYGFKRSCDFETFIKQICNTPCHKINRHFCPQYLFIEYNDTIISDRILKFENIKHDWEILQQILKIDYNICLHDLPILNSTDSTYITSYHRYYTPELINLVQDKFKIDLDLFNYEY